LKAQELGNIWRLAEVVIRKISKSPNQKEFLGSKHPALKIKIKFC
jgi:hypothetical protein